MHKKELLKQYLFSSTVLIAGLAFMMSSNLRAEEEAAINNLKQTGKAFAKIARDVSPAVVNIQLEINPKTSDMDMGDPFGMMPFRMPPSTSQRIFAQGSGFIITPDGYIVTNNHVVENATKIMVKLYDETEYEARVIGTDPQSDVAVIKIPAKSLPIVKLGDSDKVEVGEWVVAMGNPLGLSHSLSAGIISAVGRNSMGLADYESFIQTDAAINVGNSGGPLINLEGNVIGINTAIASRTGGYMGIGFAIPINMAKTVIDQLMLDGKVVRGFLGVKIQPLTQDLADSFGIKSKNGILVAEAMPDSPASKAGLQQGDVIVSLDGKEVKNVGKFRNDVAGMLPDSKHNLSVVRKGKTVTVPIVIGNLDANAATVASATDVQATTVKKLGLTVQNITPDIAGKIGTEPGVGVIISDIETDSIAQFSRLARGMVILEVNGERINSAQQFKGSVEKSKKPLRLLMQYQSNMWYVVLNIS